MCSRRPGEQLERLGAGDENLGCMGSDVAHVKEPFNNCSEFQEQWRCMLLLVGPEP